MTAIIAAVARNGVIGANRRIPWDIPEDRTHFKELTMGHILVMGRRTYEEIGRPLPGRITIVVSRTLAAESVGSPALKADEVLSAEAPHALNASDAFVREPLMKAQAPASNASDALLTSPLMKPPVPTLNEGTGLLFASSLEDALRLAGETVPEKTVFIAGGGMLYEAALPLADVLYLTEIDAEIPGDTFFPAAAFAGQPLFIESEVTGSGVSADGLAYRYVTYRRRMP